ncbi:MAG: hypothetical protein RIR10_1780, partial [Planctomycetota bacterium]
MSPLLKRFLITSALAIGVVFVGILVAQGSPRKKSDAAEASTTASQADSQTTSPASPDAGGSAAQASAAAADSNAPSNAATNTAANANTASPAGSVEAPRYTARVPAGMTAPEAPQKLGSLDP